MDTLRKVNLNSIGFGLLWGMQLTFLFPETLFITASYRGADIFNYCLAIGIILSSLFLYIHSRFTSKNSAKTHKPFNSALTIHAPLLLISILFIFITPYTQAAATIQIIAGIFAGIGLGLGFLSWLQLFSFRDFDEARASLLLSLIIGIVLFTLLGWAQPTLRLIGLAIASIASGIFGHRYLNVKTGPAEESALAEKSILLDNKMTCFAVLALGFVYGISGPITLNSSSESISGLPNLLGHLIIFIISILLLAFLTVTLPRKANVALLFQGIFPVVIASLIFLPFAGSWYEEIFGLIIALAYQLTEVLLFFSFATITYRSLYFKVSCLPLACMWTGITIGLFCGQQLFTTSDDQFFILTAITVIAFYLLSMVLFLLLGIRKKQSELIATSEVQKDFLEPTPEENAFDAACRAIAQRCELSEREAEVMTYLARGRSGTFIAEKLYLSPNTVKGYIKTLYAKLDVHSKQDVIDLVEQEQH